jgi:hypothetical protein
MSPTEKSNEDLTPLEEALAGLVPRADRLDREEWMYLAGQASRDRHRWMWPAAFAGMTAFAGVLLALLLGRPEAGLVPARQPMANLPQGAKSPEAPIDVPHSPIPEERRVDRTPVLAGGPGDGAEIMRPEEEGIPSRPFLTPRPAPGTNPYLLAQILDRGLESLPVPAVPPGLKMEESRPPVSSREYLEKLLQSLGPPGAPGRSNVPDSFKPARS